MKSSNLVELVHSQNKTALSNRTEIASAHEATTAGSVVRMDSGTGTMEMVGRNSKIIALRRPSLFSPFCLYRTIWNAEGTHLARSNNMKGH